MDENGACKFPADKLTDVCNNIEPFLKVEEDRVKAVKAARTIAEIKAAFTGKKTK
jgi:hypothetical protein